MTFLDCSPKGGEEEVLQDGLVEAALFVLITIFGKPVAKQASGGPGGKKVFGDELLLMQKPAENHPREQPDERLGIAIVSILLCAIWKVGVQTCPVEPVTDFNEEQLVERLNVEGLLPSVVKCVEIGLIVPN